jgi:hypothetical protein
MVLARHALFVRVSVGSIALLVLSYYVVESNVALILWCGSYVGFEVFYVSRCLFVCVACTLFLIR